jgi:hypothetical protein
LIEVKANFQRYILRIILFIKTAVSINNSLDPEPQTLSGLHHGAPVEGPQHLLHLLDQILGFVARLFNDPYFRFAPYKIAKRVTIRRAGRPESADLLLLHLCNLLQGLHEPALRPLAIVGKGAIQLKDLMVISSYLVHPTTPVSHKFVKHFFTIVTVLLLMFPKALNLYHGISGAKSGDSPCSSSFLLIYLCSNVSVVEETQQ